MKTLLAVALVLAGLIGGCWIWLDRWLGPRTIDVPPASSGIVSGDGSGEQPLTAEQLAGISNWLASDRSGWTAQVVTAPGPAIVIKLRHTDNTATALDIYRDPPSLPGWNGTIALRQYSDPRHPHGGLQKFSADDFQPLLKLIGR